MPVRNPLIVNSALSLTLAAALAPLAAPAQTGVFYRQPAVITQGANTTPVAGSGTVTVKVYVNKDGTPGAVTVFTSTNSGDNAAATEIAKTTKYRAATRDGKPTAAYYTYKLTFKGTTASLQQPASGGESGVIGQAHALVNAGKYAEAKSALEPYITAHPGDATALTLLGVANAFGDDPTGAVAAFDKAGTIDPKYAPLAATAYTKVAQTDIGKSDDAAIAAASQAIKLTPNSPNAYNVRALAEYDKGDNASAITDFNKTLELATAVSSASKAAINANLAAAYLRSGDYTNAVAKANTAKAADPNNQLALSILNQVVVAQAIDLSKKGQLPAAVAQLETAAAQNPSQAGKYYTQASMLLSTDTKPDWGKVKAEADKALAVAPNDAQANYIAGIALANSGKTADAKTYFTKAKANVGSDADLSARIDTALKQISK